ncbi:MAG TPA: hypothetical protein PK971_05095 [Saprospiraceae bacterium]|nr:hypothetical protein [Saprospiraceae bacterium]HND87681.1 hypothetical protein [Saprospiraceae bacterium]HNG89340.1 hypothetical protein [Saprospiraceae bacterium]
MLLRTLLFLPALFLGCQSDPSSTSLAVALGLSHTAASVSPEGENPPKAYNLVFRSTDGGKTWQDVSESLPDHVAVFSSNAYVDSNEIVLPTDQGLFRSSVRSASVKWYPELGLSDHISSLAWGRAGRYALHYDGRCYQEIGRTGIWRPVFPALEGKHLRSLLETPDGILCAGTDQGLYKSADSGRSWQLKYADAPLYEVFLVDGVLFAAGQNGILRSADKGETWQVVLTRGGVGFGTRPVAGGVAAIINSGPGPWQHFHPDGVSTNLVMRSTDGGLNWKPMDESIQALGIPYDVYQIGTQLFCTLDTGLYRSSDGGKTWELVLSMAGKVFRLYPAGKTLFAIGGTEGC